VFLHHGACSSAIKRLVADVPASRERRNGVGHLYNRYLRPRSPFRVLVSKNIKAPSGQRPHHHPFVGQKIQLVMNSVTSKSVTYISEAKITFDHLQPGPRGREPLRATMTLCSQLLKTNQQATFVETRRRPQSG
jgi:hypothetical protein